MRERVAALSLALGIDAAVGEVGGKWHPVALVGRLLDAAYRPWRGAAPGTQFLGGTAAVLSAMTLAAAVAAAAERLAGRGATRVLAVALVLKPTFSIRGLLAEALSVAAALETGAIDDARFRLRALVSRPTATLSSELAASAAIESVAENLTDSFVAPLLFFAFFGLPGAVLYRVANTADAMVGYRGETEWLGKTAARLDDLLNWLPSRLSALALTAAALVAAGPGSAARACGRWRTDGGRTASPNAGRPMAAMAGALDRRLEKPGHYVLGEGLAMPQAADVRAAVRLAGLAAALVAAGVLVAEARR